MGAKAVFFDIDGTLWDADNNIPESTKIAIKKLKKAGNYAFICSGRARGYIQNPELMALDFDGVVAGCGTHIEWHGNTIYLHEIDDTLAKLTLETVRKHDIRPIFEGRNHLYFDEEDFGSDLYGKKLIRELGDRWYTIKDHVGDWEFSKLSCDIQGKETKECFEKLSPYYDFLVHNSMFVEMVPKGHSKASGIAKVCEYLKIDVFDTFAVGDSVNDLEMLKFAGTGIAMGNASDDAKQVADYVTASLNNDGIYKAMEHFGLF